MVLEARAPVAPTGIFQQVMCASDASVRCYENILNFFLPFRPRILLTIIGALAYYIKILHFLVSLWNVM